MNSPALAAVLDGHFDNHEITRVMELYRSGLRPFRVSVDMYRVIVVVDNEIVINRESVRQQLLKRLM